MTLVEGEEQRQAACAGNWELELGLAQFAGTVRKLIQSDAFQRRACQIPAKSKLDCF